MALKVTKGQICDGSISKNICREEHNLCGKFQLYHKVDKMLIFWCYATLLIACIHTQHVKHDLFLGGLGTSPPQETFENQFSLLRLNLVTI